jgi:hypothetical protein
VYYTHYFFFVVIIAVRTGDLPAQSHFKIWEDSALKGHDFSHAEESERESFGVSALEGRSYRKQNSPQELKPIEFLSIPAAQLKLCPFKAAAIYRSKSKCDCPG